MESNKFDVVIVGSGLGGLLCANILAQEGYKVCVLEKNRQIGGSLQIFSRDKCIFDTGVHYVGGLDKGEALYRLFKYFGIMDDLKMQKMDEVGFDRFIWDGEEKVYMYGQGYDKFIKNLVKDFPEEERAIVEFCDKIRYICSKFPMYELKEEPSELMMDTELLTINTRAYLKQLTPNIRLQNVLAASNGLYAGVADKSPLYVHALVLNSYIISSYRFTDGSAQIARLLSKTIKDNNGVILNYAKVTEFVMDGEKVGYVQLEDGRKIEGETFISAIHPEPTLDMLKTDKIRKAYRKRVKEMDSTMSAFILYLVMKKDSFEYQKHNVYYFGEEDVWNPINYTEENFGDSFAVYYGAHSKSEEYAQGIIVIAYMRYEEVAQWKDTFYTIAEGDVRGDEYESFKKKKAEKLLKSVEKLYPNIREHIQSYYTSTPLTYRDYIGSYDGALYGILKDCNDPLKSFLAPQTKISNLLLTGQNLHMHGVYGVAIGALKTCSVLLGQKYLLDKINAAVPTEN